MRKSQLDQLGLFPDCQRFSASTFQILIAQYVLESFPQLQGEEPFSDLYEILKLVLLLDFHLFQLFAFKDRSYGIK